AYPTSVLASISAGSEGDCGELLLGACFCRRFFCLPGRRRERAKVSAACNSVSGRAQLVVLWQLAEYSLEFGQAEAVTNLHAAGRSFAFFFENVQQR
ncbi:MAG: hypothetical protein KJ000_35860, partial [Pirellulaceae bacterium]|nr:hypothetical protein [Pirellulaceae bacterium]